MQENMIQDRIGQFLQPHLKDMMFDELSENYLEKSGVKDILTGVPIPIRPADFEDLTNVKIARNMAFVIGCDINFEYRDNYIAYIKRNFGTEFVYALLNEGVEAAAANDFDYACILFRGAILLDPDNTDAIYCYGRACKDCYELGEDEDYVGRFKAESLEAFEKLTIKKPDFDMGFYFLGYAYLNLGLYIKAKLTWEEFLKLSDNEEQKAEISEWMDKLTEPVKIEEGYNLVLSGRFQEGIDILAPYGDDDRFNNWWPLWYYLGIAYKDTGRMEDAKDAFLKVLQISPSNIDTMKELADIYHTEGNEEKAEKYRKKIKVIEEYTTQETAEEVAAEMAEKTIMS